MILQLQKGLAKGCCVSAAGEKPKHVEYIHFKSNSQKVKWSFNDRFFMPKTSSDFVAG